MHGYRMIVATIRMRRLFEVFLMFSRLGLILITAFSFAVIPSAHAQNPYSPIAFEADADWQHKASGVTLPVRVLDMQRTGIRQIGKGEVDVAGIYDSQASATTATVYVYRGAIRSLPVWFDAAERTIARNPRYQNLKPVVQNAPFLLDGQAVGLRSVFSSSSKDKSTGIGMSMNADWIVKVRLTSATLEPDALDAMLSALLASLLQSSEPAAGNFEAPVNDCADPLSFDNVVQKRKSAPEDAMLAGLIGATVGPEGHDSAATDAPPVYCRDATLPFGYVYRRIDTNDSYILALGDTGRAVVIGPGTSLEPKDDEKYFSITAILPEMNVMFPNYDRLPSPTQVMQILQTERPLATTQRGSEGATINIGIGSK